MPVVDPREILREISPNDVPADEPPEVANYRLADVQGVACAFCSKFAFTGVSAGGKDAGDNETEVPGLPKGVCDLWEANVDGWYVCDRFSSGPPSFDHNGEEVWDFADDERAFAEVHLAGTAQTEKDGFVVKEILRTGEWPCMPTTAGVKDKPLFIVRDGASDPDAGVISMEEIVANFKAGAIPAPQIPLSDDRNDHKNITRLNTGFVRDVWIEDSEGVAKLVAKLEFTEPEVREKALRGTYADVSCGIPWKVRSRGKEYGTSLEHVSITNKPWVDGLGPFVALSQGGEDAKEPTITHFAQQVAADKVEPTLEEIRTGAQQALVVQLSLRPDYKVVDVSQEGTVKVAHSYAELAWNVPYTVSEDRTITLSNVTDWETIEENEGDSAAPPAPKEQPPPSTFSDELVEAWRLREHRLGQPTGNGSGGGRMSSLRVEELERLELSDEARSALTPLFEENKRLRKENQERAANARIEELKALGLGARPGALTFYRSVMLSDDGGPAVVLSDNGAETKLTAQEVLDRFIEAIKAPESQKIVLSDQAHETGATDPPPKTAEGENDDVETRVSNAKSALYGDAKK